MYAACIFSNYEFLISLDLDDVHGGHGQPRTVHHAADVTSQADVVKIVLCCLHLCMEMYVCMNVCLCGCVQSN